MAQVIINDMPEDMSSEVEAAPLERPKLKGRQRLLQGLQRMSSSSSLVIMGRGTGTYNGRGKASMSCMSLASPVPQFDSFNSTSPFSDQSVGYSTAPTSVAGTPAPDMGCLDIFMARTRSIENEKLGRSSTAPLPSFLSFGNQLDYFSLAQSKPNFDFWGMMPNELKVQVFQFLTPKEIVRCSAVCKEWHKMCFDGQLWSRLDASKFYRDIPSDTLIKIMTSAGPFVKDLNLRGCVQMRDHWGTESEKIANVCTNLENFWIEGCRIDRSSVHIFLLRNPRLVSINVSGINTLNNSAMKIIGQNCPRLEYLDVSWCENIDTKGLLRVVQGCPNLADLRAAEIRGFNDEEFLLELHQRNSLERLLISHCTDMDDQSLLTLLHGKDAQFDVLTGQALVPSRKLKHLDMSRCRALTNKAVQALAYTCPNLVGLRLSQCTGLTDDAITDILENARNITHLDIEELDLTNHALTVLAKSPSAPHLTHLNVSYCENVGDAGMLPVLKSCTSIEQLDMDNTRVSDLALTEAAAQMRERNRLATSGNQTGRPKVGLRLVVYDCQNVTWTGVREIMSRNAEFFRRAQNSEAPVYPKEIISLKCFYGYQPTVNEHTKRVLKGELARATLLERKWAEYMVATEEAGATGSGWRRRRRRLREAERVHADEQEEVRGGRRRARSGGCVVM
jgi:F-box and leucine-rich repeat protein 2/20